MHNELSVNGFVIEFQENNQMLFTFNIKYLCIECVLSRLLENALNINLRKGQYLPNFLTQFIYVCFRLIYNS